MQSLFSCPVRPPVIGAAGHHVKPLPYIKRQQAAGNERGESLLYKVCRCGKLIPQTMRLCEQCEEREQSRHVIYNNTRRDQRAAEFYVSKEWREIRPVIMSVYDYIDIYAQRIRPDSSHHRT